MPARPAAFRVPAPAGEKCDAAHTPGRPGPRQSAAAASDLESPAMTDPEADPLDYGRMIGAALRGVVRQALQVVADQGLPGEHHLFVSFRTGEPGVVLPAHLRQSYPDEMTIVLQHQFWDLQVDAQAFSVSLRFSGRLERLTVPFEAVTAFSDPSVELALRFVPAPAPAEAEPDKPRAREGPGGTDGADKVVDFESFRRRD